MIRQRSAIAVLCVSTTILAGLGASKRREEPDGRAILWRDPGNIERIDLAFPPAGRSNAPVLPLQFVEEDMTGTAPKIKVKDATDRDWSVKFGAEGSASAFSSHFVGACGYVVEAEYFVKVGKLSHVRHSDLKRVAKFIGPDGTFEN